MLKTTNAVVQQLQSELASLKSDLANVRAQMSKKDSENMAEVASLKSKLVIVKPQLSQKQEYASAVAVKPSSHSRSRTNNCTTTTRE